MAVAGLFGLVIRSVHGAGHRRKIEESGVMARIAPPLLTKSILRGSLFKVIDHKQLDRPFFLLHRQAEILDCVPHC